MAISVKKAVLWRLEEEKRQGKLAQTLAPFATRGINLQLVMSYTFPAPEGKFACEVYPVTEEGAEEAAREAGLAPSPDVHGLVVEGDDHPGLGFEISRALGDAGIEVHFAMLTVVGNKFTGVFGFGSEKDVNESSEIIRQAQVKSEQLIGDFSPRIENPHGSPTGLA